MPGRGVVVFVIIAVMAVIIAAAAAVFAVVASTQTEEPGLRSAFGARLAERFGVRRVEDRGTLRSLSAMHERSTARQD